jgi:hypothetical protein
MARRSTMEGKASRAKGREPTRKKRRIAPAGPRHKVADKREQSDRYFKELKEAREQQAATAEILKVINASRGDLTPIFDIILEKAHSLCDVPCGSLQLFEDDHTRAVAVRGMTEPFEKFLRQGYRLDPNQPVQSVRPFQIDDLAKVVAGTPHGSALRVAFELGRVRTMLSVPLVRDAAVLGRIVAARQEAEDKALFFDATFLPLVEKLAPELPTVRLMVLMVDRSHMPQTTLAGLQCYEDFIAGLRLAFGVLPLLHVGDNWQSERRTLFASLRHAALSHDRRCPLDRIYGTGHDSCDDSDVPTRGGHQSRCPCSLPN